MPRGSTVRFRPAGGLVTTSLLIGLLTTIASPGAAKTDDAAQPDGPTPQIAGGYFPSPDAWPWVTSIVDPTRPSIQGDLGRGVCTAVLISPTRVLTAAHCVVGADGRTPRPAAKFQALVGRRDLTLVNQGQRRDVTGVAVHPKVYLPKTGVHTHHAFYDIAVLFLSSPVTIPPAVIGTPTDWNTWGTVMGFGHFNYDHSNPQYDQHLRAADYDLLSDAQCSAWFDDATQHYYPSIHVCANNAPGGEVDCITHGDSGGPLMVRRNDGSWRLIGITSFYPYRSDRCGAGGPFGFAWVAGSEMRNWPLTVPHPPTTVRIQRGDLRGYAKYMIKQNTKGKIKKLRTSCKRQSATSFRCGVKWRITSYRYRGKARFFTFTQQGKSYWNYSFKGKRTRPGCASCVKRLRW